jgi:hypothetical protein
MEIADPSAALTFNPRVSLTLERRGGVVVSVAVEGPVRGRPLRRARFLREREPAIVDLLERVARREGAVAVDLDAAAWSRLADVGLLVPAASVPAPVRFRCTPGEVPADLWLRGARVDPPADALVVDPSLVYRDTPELPPEVLRALRGAPSPFAEEAASAIVSPAGVPLPCFLAISEAQRAIFRALVPGAPPADLAPEVRDALLAVGVLCDPVAAERRRVARAEAMVEASAMLRHARHAVVHEMVHPAQLAALRRYYRALVDEGYVALGDKQSPARYVAHGEPLARVLHHRLTGLATALAGEPMKPSYTYFSAYLGGAVLAPHRDRAQCELSISLLLDESPEPDGPSSWPLHLEAPGGEVALRLMLGDGAVFYGRELRHFRHALPEGRRSTSLIFHFVPEGFTGSLD